MLIDALAKRPASLQRSEMCFFGDQCFAPTELRSRSGSWFYKHLVPLGLKTTAVKNTPLLLR